MFILVAERESHSRYSQFARLSARKSAVRRLPFSLSYELQCIIFLILKQFVVILSFQITGNCHKTIVTMKVSYDWLKEYIDIDLSPDEAADLLTSLGLEVEAVEYPDDFSNVVVGYIDECGNIPGSHNKYCKVNVGGGERLDIICGAPNCRAGILAPVVLPGGRLPDGRIIERTVIADRASEGMLLSQAELNLGGEAEEIWELNKEETVSCGLFPGLNLRDKFPADAVFKLEITHNRPDCLCHIGVAREIAAALGKKLKKPELTFEESAPPAEGELEVIILDTQKCPRYCGRLVFDVEVKPSPRWMQRRLLAVGLRPINNIVDVTNYVLMEYGHPLHAFDFSLISGGKIVVKTADQSQDFITLDEKSHTLSADDLLICDAEKGVALAGVMGGLNSEINQNTRGILLECAFFDPVGIRLTSKRRGIVSDSSYRFERGVDPNAVPEVIDRAAQLAVETAGGKILSGRVDNYARKIHPVEIELRPSKVNRLLGTRITAEKMGDCLRRLELEVRKNGDKFAVKIPTFRSDISAEIDLVEEIARLNGYDRIPADSTTAIPLEVEPLEKEDFADAVRQALVELGCRETLTYSMRPEGKAVIAGGKTISVRNPISKDFAVLRGDLLAPLLEAAAYNFNRGAESIAIFELGDVFKPGKTGVSEFRMIAGLLSGKAENTHWSRKDRQFDYFHLKGLAENFLHIISLDNYDLSPYIEEEGVFEYAQAASRENVNVGILGKLKGEVCQRFEVEYPVFVFAFDFDSLLKHHRKLPRFQDFSRYPAVNRDLSLIFSEDVSAQSIENGVKNSAGPHLVSLKFFDLYRGEKLGPGKKSLSISLRFQSMDRTMNDAEVDEAIAGVVIDLKKLGGELRDK